MAKHNDIILAVDDNPTNLTLLVDYLERLGFEVSAAEDGESALELLDYITPDIILLDIMMPGMDGFETCRSLKAIPAVQDIPVIFMTALSETSDKVKGFEAGAVDYITKPIQHEELLARITTHLKIKQLQQQLQTKNQQLEAEVDERKMLQEMLNEHGKHLEQRVVNRTRKLEAIANLSGRLNEMVEIESLLSELVNQLQDNFGYYYTHVYLVDHETNTLIMVEGSGQIGQALKALQHSLPFDVGIVGWVAQHNLPYITGDVASDNYFFANTLLPKTQSELAIPIHLSGKLLGVLDIQSEKQYAFTSEDISIMQSIADQTAIALNNAQLLAERQATIAKLQATDETKSRFITMISHELRTPLHAINGFAELLLLGLSGELSPQVHEDIKLIYNNGTHLLALINDIIDISQIETGHIQISPTMLEIPTIIDELLSQTRPLIQTRRITNASSLTIITEIPDKLPLIYADKTRLKQILFNLLSNAIKFTPDGEIIIGVDLIENNKIKFSVKDTGIGVPLDKQQIIFTLFQQADMSNTRQYGGLGLGLAICKTLVQLHGGEIGLISEAGVGAEFYFTLPLIEAEAT